MAKNDDFKKNSKRYQILEAKIGFSVQKNIGIEVWMMKFGQKLL